jgi:hypothetical protein
MLHIELLKKKKRKPELHIKTGTNLKNNIKPGAMAHVCNLNYLGG